MDKTMISQCCDYLSLDELLQKEEFIKKEYYIIKDKFLIFTQKIIDNLSNKEILDELLKKEKTLNIEYKNNLECGIIIYYTLSQKYLNVNKKKYDYYLNLVNKSEKEISKIKN